MHYVGGKARIAKDFLPIILEGRKKGQWYVEPFCGGCNVIDKVLEKDGPRLAVDSNQYLIALWNAVVYEGWEPPDYVSENEYKKIRKHKDNYPPALIGWVGTQCTNNNAWMSGFGHNDSEGNYSIGRDGECHQLERKRALLRQVNLLKGVTFVNDSYLYVDIPENSIIYCDPPYRSVGHWYNKECRIDFETFWEWVRDKTREGHKVFVSELEAPDDFDCVWSKEVIYRSNSFESNRKNQPIMRKTEKLFVYNEKKERKVI